MCLLNSTKSDENKYLFEEHIIKNKLKKVKVTPEPL